MERFVGPISMKGSHRKDFSFKTANGRVRGQNPETAKGGVRRSKANEGRASNQEEEGREEPLKGAQTLSWEGGALFLISG